MSNKMEHQILECDIVSDLLPLYHDGVVKDTTAAHIKKHLEQCDSCREEYESLCVELLIEGQTISTREKFTETFRKIKRRRILASVLLSVLLCAFLIGGYFVQAQIPIVNIPDEEIEVHRVYRYATEEGYKFFVLYSHPCYDHTTGRISVSEGEDGRTLVMDIKKPVIAKKHENNGAVENIWLYECGYSTGDNGERVFEEFDSVEFAGKIVWSNEEETEDVIPDYVRAYEAFSLAVYYQPDLLIGQSDSDTSAAVITSWVTDLENGYLGAGYSDGRNILWDLDGNVIYEDFSDME